MTTACVSSSITKVAYLEPGGREIAGVKKEIQVEACTYNYYNAFHELVKKVRKTYPDVREWRDSEISYAVKLIGVNQKHCYTLKGNPVRKLK